MTIHLRRFSDYKDIDYIDDGEDATACCGMLIGSNGGHWATNVEFFLSWPDYCKKCIDSPDGQLRLLSYAAER